MDFLEALPPCHLSNCGFSSLFTLLDLPPKCGVMGNFMCQMNWAKGLMKMSW